MQFDRKDFSNETLLDLYRQLLYPRLIEEKMLLLLRQGKISKWFSGIGQEAISVGVTCALKNEDWILPMHRNLGVFTSRQLPLNKLFNQWLGNLTEYSKGRERSFHFGSREHRICGMISHLGPQMTVANGIALAHKFKKEQQVSVVFTGEGGTSEGDFHEALNLASVWDLPVLFIIENNGYALSTPANEQYRCFSLADRAKGYGMEGIRIDGNNILQVYDTIKGIKEHCIKHQRPYLIECMTFRMRGHEEASGTGYVPQELFDLWEKQDPITNYEDYLTGQSLLSKQSILETKKELNEKIESELKIASKFKRVIPDTKVELSDVYATPVKSNVQIIDNASPHFKNQNTYSSELRFIDSISQALRQSLQKQPNLILLGQDIAEYGGAFKITEGFVKEFGKERIRNTPISESATIGTAFGLSIKGYKSVVEMQFADFVTMGFNQIVNNLAKSHYRWGQNADVVIRMPTGGGVSAGPFHSQSNEAWFVHTPGLKVVYPSSPMDAKGLLIASINDPNPVLFFEHKALYRSISGMVPSEYYEIEIGKAAHIKAGTDISIITYGIGVHWALEFANNHPKISVDILDLRTLLPFDFEAIRLAVARTGKILVLHEDTQTGGIGGEIAAWIGEHCFDSLDAPVMRCSSLDTPIPFNPDLEKIFMAYSRLEESINRLLKY